MPPAASEERKIVTVLFCDLVGFTARSDRADPEDVRAALRPYHALLRSEIASFGGTVEKFIGDAVMAVFGAPVAHEDDAERAVRAGLDILDAIDELNRSEPSLGIAVRVGINTGEALVTLSARPELGEGIVTGDVVNSASRLQAVAPVGKVVVGEQTYRTTARVFDYEALPPVEVKGKSEALLVWRAVAPRARFGIDVERGAFSPFVGRDDEVEVLKRTYGRCVRESSVQLVTITGEPGVGKTRLVEEFSNFIEGLPDLVSWRQGRCLPYGDGITFWALGEIVKAQAGILESDGTDEARQKLGIAIEEAVEDESDREWILSQTAPLVGIATSQPKDAADRSESFTAWRRLFEAIATRGPMVLVFEDLHWADEALRAFLEHLVDWSSGVPLFVLCTARPELFEQAAGWGGGKRNSNTIALGPLTEEETARLVSDLLERSVLPPKTQALVLERAGGNPLYAAEFVRMVKDRGVVGDGMDLAGSEDEIPVPDSVQALIAARLDTLAADKKSLLQDASVMGRVFWDGAVATIGNRPGRDVHESLHALSAKELVKPARNSSVKDQREYTFWHALVRDVAYAQIPRAGRIQKHRAAAAWIEGIAGERIQDHAELLAHHYLEALRIAETVGGTDDAVDLKQRARQFLTLAGDRALNLDAGRAEQYYRRALELFSPDDLGRTRVLVSAGKAAYHAGRLGESERDLRMAIEECDRIGDRVGAADAWAALSYPLRQTKGPAPAFETLERAIKIFEEEGNDPERLAAAYADAAYALMLGGRSREAIEFAERALTAARDMPPGAPLYLGLEAKGFARWDLGDVGGIEDAKEALSLALDHGTAAHAVRIQGNLGESIWFSEGPRQALDWAREEVDFAARRGLTNMEMVGNTLALEQMFEIGHWDALLEQAAVLERHHRKTGAAWARLLAGVLATRVRLMRGLARDASALLGEYLDEVREIAFTTVLAQVFSLAAMTAVSEQRIDDVAAPLAELDRLARELSGMSQYVGIQLPDVIRSYVAANDIRRAEELLTNLDLPPFPRFEHAVLTSRAAIAEARQQLEYAARSYVDAAEGWNQYGHVVEDATCALGAGRCLAQLGKPDARIWLQRSLDIFGRLEAKPRIAEAEAWLERAR
ncbi:MAG: adenylate/guanylate cyclase domain-containing protein [Actinomycetota bacterium]